MRINYFSCRNFRNLEETEIKEFDERLKVDREKLTFEKQKHKDDVTLKKKALTKNSSSK